MTVSVLDLQRCSEKGMTEETSAEAFSWKQSVTAPTWRSAADCSTVWKQRPESSIVDGQEKRVHRTTSDDGEAELDTDRIWSVDDAA